MTLTSELLDRVRQKVASKDRLNRLTATISSTSAATFTYEYATNPPAAGNRVAIDLEDLYVWEVDAATKTATVQRGHNSTAAATHSDNSIVYVSPTYSAFDMLTAVNDELAALPGWGIAKWNEVTLSASSVTGYNLTGVTNLIKVHKVSWEDTTETNFRPIHRRLWRVNPDVPTGDFASGYQLAVFDNTPAAGASLQVVYTTPFTALSTLAQNVETISGIPSRCISLVAVGAALRLTSGRPIARTDLTSQGDTRRADEVSTSDTRMAQSPLLLEYQRLLSAELRIQAKEHG